VFFSSTPNPSSQEEGSLLMEVILPRGGESADGSHPPKRRGVCWWKSSSQEEGSLLVEILLPK